jgi:hypothetical protein
LSSVNIPDGVDIFVTADFGTSSLLEPITFPVTTTEKVPVWRLNEFLKYFPFHKIPIIDHIKIDTQGLNFEILKGIGLYLEKIACITLELDPGHYIGTTNNQKMSIFFADHGFFQVKCGTHRKTIKLLRKMDFLIWRIFKRFDVKIEAGDPTYLNKKLSREYMDGKLRIYQRG